MSYATWLLAVALYLRVYRRRSIFEAAGHYRRWFEGGLSPRQAAELAR